jgi:hypothetical protein
LGANLPKNRSHTAYLARARLADVHLGTPAAALTTNWPKSMSEPAAQVISEPVAEVGRNPQT